MTSMTSLTLSIRIDQDITGTYIYAYDDYSAGPVISGPKTQEILDVLSGLLMFEIQVEENVDQEIKTISSQALGNNLFYQKLAD